MCPFRHISGEKTVVCKHWLRGLCKKGDQCEFLHEYDMTKMPECYFYSKFGECSNKECPFLHIDPESKIKDCPWYDRGFCKHGPLCRHRHTRRVICVNYLVGFCPEGPSCKFMHPRFELPMGTTEQPPLPQQTQPPTKVLCPGPSLALWHCQPWQCPCNRELGAAVNAWSVTDPAGDFVRGPENTGQEGSLPEFQQKILIRGAEQFASASRDGGLSAGTEHPLGFSLAWQVPWWLSSTLLEPTSGARVEGSMRATCLPLLRWRGGLA
ncbi:cleavage and polyadenylation specific factor 4 [Phyllostomus discolor]|nr:cleavage and polyadenylation specific factor 4 [Phyllostomus discolor]